MGETREGRCLCGEVTFTAIPQGDEIDVCHCGMCRKLNAGPTMVVPVTELTFTGKAPAVYASSDWAERLSCGTCGSSVAYRSKDGRFVGLAAFLFEPPLDWPLKTEIFVDEKPGCYAFAGIEKQMTGAEVMAAFAGGDD